MATTVYSLNTTTLALTKHTSTELDGLKGLAEHKGQLYVVDATGVYDNTGTTDNGTAVSAHILTGELFLADSYEYNVPKAVIRGMGSGTCTLTRTVSEDGSASTPDTCSVTLTGQPNRHEVPLETRQEADAWQFKVSLGATGDSLSAFDVHVNPVRPRVRLG